MLPRGSVLADSSVCGVAGDALGRRSRDCGARASSAMIVINTRTIEIVTTNFMSAFLAILAPGVWSPSPAVMMRVAAQVTSSYAIQHFGAVAGNSTPERRRRNPRQL